MDELNDGNPVVVADEPSAAAAEIVADENALKAENEQGQSLPDDEHEPEREKQPKWARKAISRLARQKLEAQDKANRLEAELATARKEAEELRVKAVQPAEMPRQDQFETVEEYTLAAAKWQYEQLDKERQVRENTDKMKGHQESTAREFETKRDKMYDAGVEKYGDEFVDKIAAIPASIMTMSVAEDVLAAENPAVVALFFAEHLDEAARIAAMEPRQRAVAIGRIEARLTAKPVSQKSKAPEPIKPVSGKGGGVIEKHPTEMSILELKAFLGN